MRFSAATMATMGLLTPCALYAQGSTPKPPAAVYWISLETIAKATGESSAASPGVPTAEVAKQMRLELGSPAAPGTQPRATHAIPPALMMGEKLALGPPPRNGASAGASARTPGNPTLRGRTLLYWGCGETVSSGQPVVVNAPSASVGSTTPARARSSTREQQPDALGAYGTWPNSESVQRVPQAASMRGLHVVSGNFTPEMQFSIEEKHDFMPSMELLPIRKTEAGALLLNWTAVPHASGYFAAASGPGARDGDHVIWTSSEVPGAGLHLLDHLPSALIAELIKEKRVLAPQNNTCTVPAGIFGKTGAMLQLVAYGEEMNLVHPPRPREESKAWEPLWSVKVRLKSTAIAPLEEGVALSPMVSSDSGR